MVGDTPAALGGAICELMRHQAPMRTPAIDSIVDLLRRLIGILEGEPGNGDEEDAPPQLPADELAKVAPQFVYNTMTFLESVLAPAGGGGANNFSGRRGQDTPQQDIVKTFVSKVRISSALPTRL